MLLTEWLTNRIAEEMKDDGFSWCKQQVVMSQKFFVMEETRIEGSKKNAKIQNRNSRERQKFCPDDVGVTSAAPFARHK